MSHFPTATLNEVCDFQNGGTPSKAVERYFTGNIPWITGADLVGPIAQNARSFITEEAITSSATNKVPAGTVLLVTRTSVGKVAIAGTELCFSQDITALLPDSAKLDAGYLVHFLRTKEDHFSRYARGATIKGITRQVVADLVIPLPPLEEQRRIAAILDQAETLRTQRRTALALLDSLTQSLFLDMFGDPVANPKGWLFTRLDQLVRHDDSINYGVVQPGDAFDEGVPLVRVGDVVDGNFDPAALKRIDATIEQGYKRSRLRGDEILVTCVGSIGVVALVEPSMKGFNIARAVSRIPASEKVNRDFLASYLRTDYVQRYFTSELRTVSQPTLNIKQICETRVIQPPLDLQQTFATRIASIEALQATHRRALAALDALFASLQQRAFAGTL